MKDIIDKQYEIKRFFKAIFQDIDFSNETIRAFENNRDKTYQKATYFNDIDDLVSFATNKYRKFNNTYFNLCSTNGSGGAEENLIKRYVMGFDFDKKDLGVEFSHKHIIEKFKEFGLWYHMIIDSGNGYHAYMCIEPTQDMDKVEEVQIVHVNIEMLKFSNMKMHKNFNIILIITTFLLDHFIYILSSI